jgi:hypothetical protein
MSTTSSHEMSHANYLNLEMYTEAGCDPWRRGHNLLIGVHSLFESLKEGPNSSRNASKLFKGGD